MAVTLLQSTKKVVTATTASTTLAFGFNLTAGSLVCLAQAHFEGSGNVAVTPVDTLSHVYVPMQADQVLATNNHLRCWYKENGSAGADTVTFDVTGTVNADITVVIAEFSGIVTSGSLDKVQPGTGTGTAASSGATATTAQADELLWGALTHTGGTFSITETGSASIVQEDEVGASNMPIAVSYRVVAAAAAYSATWTIGSSVTWMGQITTFKAVAGGAAFVARPPLTVLQAVHRAGSY